MSEPRAAGARVLLIGGAGFMGPHVARALLAHGHDVTVLSRGRLPLPDGVHALEADRADAHALARALEGRRFDFTVDFLAFDAADVERLLLVPYAALGRYVMISTGQTCLVVRDAKPPYREEDSDRPVIPEPERDSADHVQWTYGVGKRRAEQFLLGLRGSHGMRALVLRLPIVQGEGDSSLRLWAWIERLRDGGPVILPDGGERMVRHLDVADLSRTIVTLLESAPPRHSVYHLAPPDSLSLRTFLERVAELAGVREPRFVDASWEELAAADLPRDIAPYAGPWASVLDASRAAGEWGFVGTRAEDYLPRVVGAHLAQPPTVSHVGYAHRAREIAWAEGRLASRN